MWKTVSVASGAGLVFIYMTFFPPAAFSLIRDNLEK